MTSPWYDKLGNPIPPERWGELHADENYMQIGRDDIGPMHVSTVWVGINMNYTREGAPVIFETMIFGGPMDLATWRYSDEDEARNHHNLIVYGLTSGRLLLAAAREIEDGRRRHGQVKWARDWIRHMSK